MGISGSVPVADLGLFGLLDLRRPMRLDAGPGLELTEDDVRRGLPVRVGVGVRRVSDGVVPALWAGENELLGERAIERRRVYFALGRAAARDALAGLGIEGVAIGRGPAGEPVWPDGIVGAITHAGDTVISLVGSKTEYAGLGVDVEELARGPSARAARLVCRPTELAWADVESGTRRLSMLFSAKEAVFKAVFPIERAWLGFADAELTWVAERRGFDARLLKSGGAQYPVGSVVRVHCTVTPTQVLSTAYCAPRSGNA
jgi:enterobactin synthetase component D